jgi:HEPN domain-containing protein
VTEQRSREERVIVNSFASECLRNVADADYIAARIHYRLGLIQQFQWSALQAIEKYLKSILLYNGRSAKGLSHDLIKALERVESIKEFDIDLEEHERKLIRHLHENGQNRYLEQSSYTIGKELLWLDSTVWSLRRYCQVLNYDVADTKGKKINMLDLTLKTIRSDWHKKNPHKFRLIGGFLESVLDRKRNDELRQALIWKNFKYGKRKKYAIKNFMQRGYSVNPPHIRDPKQFKIIEKYVDFPKRIQRLFAEGLGDR